MSIVPTFDELTRALDAHQLSYAVMRLDGDLRLVVTERGGRLMGPFLPDGMSMTWINPLFRDAPALGEFLRSGDWNMGGDRIWIAPEVQYLATDRTNFNETCVIPPAMDPGAWELSGPTSDDGWELRQRAVLEAYSLARGTKTLDVERVVARAANPLRALRTFSALMERVDFAGWRQSVAMAEAETDDIVSETWIVLQVRPGGRILVPCTPRAEVTEIGGYRNPVPMAGRTVRDGALRIAVTGDRQWKIGVRAAHVLGRMGYLRDLEGGRTLLLVRSFGVDPSGLYSEESFDQPGNNGNAVHIYHDDGELGGFGEMECSAPAIGGPTGRSRCLDSFVTWLFLGPPAAVREIGLHLIGVDTALAPAP
jgi:hypothetical protein